ncbi:MAG: kelch repeat-containing protein [Byssovorax sp.]
MRRRGHALFIVLLAGCADRPAERAEQTGAAPLAAEERPSWTEAGAMSVARHGHTATRLFGGNVLVAGGQKLGAFDTGDVYLNTAEIYQIGTKSFVKAGTMVSRRVRHVAALLPGGDVLVAGGAPDAKSAGTAEVFHVATKTWTAIAAPLTHPRVSAAAASLLDDRVLLTGGDADAIAGTAEVYDPAAGMFTEVASMSTRRRRHTATRLADGRVLVAGGHLYQANDDSGVSLATAEIYDPVKDQWFPVPPMKHARSRHTAALLGDGRVLVAGGASTESATASAELFDPKKKAWIDAPSMASARSSHTATALDNGAVLIAGGVDATSSALRSAELFDPSDDRWVTLGPMIHGRLLHVAAPTPGGGALVAGGEDQATAELYAPGDDGASCSTGYECGSGHCADGVCCDEACDGLCRTCAAEGSVGTCTHAAAGTDPRVECGQGGPCDDVCDGEGACVDRVGQVCSAASCQDDGTVVLEARCIARGGGCPVLTLACEPFQCGDRGGGASGCLDACTSVDDCAPGYACDPAGACVAPPDPADRDAPSCASSRGGEGREGALLFASLGAALIARRRRRWS